MEQQGRAQRRGRWRAAGVLSRALATATLGWLLAGTPADGQTPAPGRRTPPPVLRPEGQPARHGSPFYTGLYLGEDRTTPGNIRPAIREFGERMGKRPTLVKSFQTLESDFSPTGWAGQIMREVRAAGATNYVAVALTGQGRKVSTDTLLNRVLTGQLDEATRRVARHVARFGDVVLLEPGWEMNGNWSYNWQGIYNNPNAPGKFVEAWRRLVRIFREEGADNVRWVFNPNAGNPITDTSSGPGNWNWYGFYYPGDEYVDYVGAHAFNAPGLWKTPWLSFAELVSGKKGDFILPDMVGRFPDKPIIFGEIASEEGAPGAKAAWIREAYRLMIDHPQVVGAVWFDMKKETSWQLVSSPEAEQAYREVLTEPWVVTVFTDPARTGDQRTTPVLPRAGTKAEALPAVAPGVQRRVQPTARSRPRY